jgi:hypothetical protein
MKIQKLIIAAIVIQVIVFLSALALGQCKALHPIYDRTEQKYGYIDCGGKVVVPPRFRKVYDFTEGLAKIEIGDETHPYIGYLDLRGNVAIEPTFSFFSEGASAVLTSRGWGFIDRTGHTFLILDDATSDITPPLENFSNGVAMVFTDKGVKYVNKQGQMMFGRYFKEGSTSFRNGLAVVILGNKFGILKTNGKYLIQPQKNSISIFDDGTISIKRGSKWNYYTRSMKLLFTSSDELEFKDDLAFFVKDDKWGVINNFGKVIVKPKYDAPMIFDGFSEGVGVVAMNGKQGAIDKLGRIRVPLVYDLLYPMTNGLMQFQMGNSFGYIDERNRVVWQTANTSANR